jgi:hypothetical protein
MHSSFSKENKHLIPVDSHIPTLLGPFCSAGCAKIFLLSVASNNKGEINFKSKYILRLYREEFNCTFCTRVIDWI